MPNAQDDAPRFYIHWCLGFGRSGFKTVRDFNLAVKECILWHGGVLAEIYMTTGGFHPAGQNVVTMTGNVETEYVNIDGVLEERPSGHAVLIIGWRNFGNSMEFQFLNSHGPEYGGGGVNWCRSNTIYHVYVPQVLQWYA